MSKPESETTVSAGKKSPFAFYPWLVALYPMLFVVSVNYGIVRLPEIWPIALTVITAETILFFTLYAIFKPATATAALAVTITVGFFSYGQIYTQISTIPALSSLPAITVHLILMVIMLSIMGALMVVLWRIQDRLIPYSRTFNLAAIALVAIPTTLIAITSITAARAVAGRPPRLDHPFQAPASAIPADAPDIYYIILDEYARADELLELGDFDNSRFVAALEERGFILPEQSLSNYSITPLSLASSLNMQYLDDFAGIHIGEAGLIYVNPWIKNNALARQMTGLGYRYYHVSGGWYTSNINPLADVNIDFTADGPVWIESLDRSTRRASARTGFTQLFIASTMLRPFLNPLAPSSSSVLEFYDPARTHGAFALMGEIAEIEEPTFTFYHAVIPHRPWMFEADGTIVEKPQGWTWQDDPVEVEPYLQQLEYLNTLVLSMVDNILAHSETPSIIVIQGDHGFASGTTRILNAYHLPDGGNGLLYPTITPVNTWRLILDHYLGTEFGLLEDVSYISFEHYDDPFTFTLTEDGNTPAQDGK